VLVFKQTPGRAYLSAAIGLFGGAYFPITLLPHWLRIVAYVQPFTPAVDLLRHILLGTPTFERSWLELASLTAWVVVLLPVTLIVLRAAVRTSSKHGTILEY
jgi:ABC-2 type transport system permease protein